MQWEKISKNRLQQKRDGFTVVKPDIDNITVIPLFCPVCSNVMRNFLDAQFYRKWGACSNCSITYAEGNKEKWKKGWRPKL